MSQNYKKLAQNMIEAGKPATIVSGALEKHYKAQHKLDWIDAKKAEYDLVVTDQTFDEWLNATNTVLVGTETKTDDLGNEYEDEIFEEQPIHVYEEATQDVIDITVSNDSELLAYQAKVSEDKKHNELESLSITHNTVLYDANMKAIGNMGAVCSLANYRYIQLTTVGMNNDGNVLTPELAYQAVYKDTTVTWKGADNLPHTVQVESICEALNESMNAIATVIGV